MNDEPEQVAQSGWQVRQEPDDENVPDGHELTQLPPEASLLLVHVRQNVAEPEQVEHDESQVVQVTLSLGETKVPVGQLSKHCPSERNEPGRQAVHFSSSTVEAALKFDISQEVHLAPHAEEN